MVRLRAFSKTFAILAVALGLAAGACLLPQDEYQRWQLLDGTIHARARWIYERCRFDPTPIDVAFIGPSRTGAGVNAPRLGEALAARGLPSNVVNLSLPEGGRNINYAVAEQLLEHKQPRLIVIGVTEKPQRTGHSAFKYLAPAELIANPGYIGNLNYLSDLIYLPYRQMRLFVANLAPGPMGLTKTFEPSVYLGQSIDTTGSVVLPDGRIKEGESPASAMELHRGVRKLEAGLHPPMLPASLADVEFGDERYYIRKITALAKARHVKIAFLFLPYYSGPKQVQEERFYEGFGPVWNEGYLAPHANLYADYGHLTRKGAEQLTDALAEPVGELLTPTKVRR